MGDRNVERALAYWPDLPADLLTLLVVMAWHSIDSARPTCSLDRPTLANEGLGYNEPGKLPRTVRSATTRALDRLWKAGAIGLRTRSAPGRRAAYVLNLDGPDSEAAEQCRAMRAHRLTQLAARRASRPDGPV